MNNSEILGYVGKSISDFEPRYFNNLYDTDYHLMIVLVDGVQMIKAWRCPQMGQFNFMK